MSLQKSKKVLAPATGVTRHGNCHSVVDTRSDVILMMKLIQETEVFKIQPGRGSVEGSEFVDLFAKGSGIINAGVPLKNYKKRVRGNQSQSKDGTDIFEADENTGIERNNRTTVDSDYGSNNM